MHGIGYHLLGDFSGISDAIVTNKNLLMAGFQELLSAEGLTIVKTIDHQFIPHGLTVVYILQESHAVIHTYPEHGYISFELFSCQPFNVERVEAELKKLTLPKSSYIQTIQRGLETKQGVSNP